MRKISSLIIAGAVAFAAVPAFASGLSLSFVGVGDFANVNQTDFPTSTTVSGIPITGISTDTKMKLGFGGGVLLDTMLTRTAGLEFGGLYITRKTEFDTTETALGVTSTTDSVTQANYIQVPVLFRYWFSSNFSLGVGGYYAEGIGNVKTLDTSGNETDSQSWSDAQLKKSDYGAIGSLALHIPLGSSIRFLLDGRYVYGLKDFDDSGTGGHQKYRDIQILAGLSIPLGGRRSNW